MRGLGGFISSATVETIHHQSEDDMMDAMGVYVKKGPWTHEEDALLINCVQVHGERRWNSVAHFAGLKRTGKSCRLRWLNYLRPDVRRGNITHEEQLLILELHSRWGNRWSQIAKYLPGRTDNEIKNYWRTRVKKLAKQLDYHVNSEEFRDAMQNVWMPQMVERIRGANSSAFTTYNNMLIGPTTMKVSTDSGSISRWSQQEANHDPRIVNIIPDRVVPGMTSSDSVSGTQLFSDLSNQFDSGYWQYSQITQLGLSPHDQNTSDDTAYWSTGPDPERVVNYNLEDMGGDAWFDGGLGTYSTSLESFWNEENVRRFL